MCGIVGILGDKCVSERLVSALERLEYRGYDSAGLAVMNRATVSRRRAVGNVSELRALLEVAPVAGHTGIAHTRWATHGVPSEANAHPHQAGTVAVVHNGIIENHADLRRTLEQQGEVFLSQTDTEVVAHLCNRHITKGMAPDAAVAATLTELKGAYALAFVFESEPDLMIVARQGSPLAIGYGVADAAGNSEMYVGSDALALAAFTDQVTYLEEGDTAILTRSRVVITDKAGSEVVRPIREIPATSLRADKGGFRHHMAREIHEQPATIGAALSAALSSDLKGLSDDIAVPEFQNADRILLVACGTASYACHVAKYWFEKFARIPVEIDIASEFRYREAPLSGREVALFVSQSGETADTLAALRHVKDRVQARIAVVNVATSSIAREADRVMDILAGPEIGVASTKAFTGQLTLLACLALECARQRGTIDAPTLSKAVRDLATIPRLVADTLTLESKIETIADVFADTRDALFLGRGNLYPMALEGALKLKEISYIHAEGYAAGELKHGPIALVDQHVPVVAFAPSGPLFDKTLSNMEEVAARGGELIMMTDQTGAAAAGDTADHLLVLPDVADDWAPIVHAIVAQLLAYYVAVLRGTDVDQPRNLAKSVTVE